MPPLRRSAQRRADQRREPATCSSRSPTTRPSARTRSASPATTTAWPPPIPSPPRSATNWRSNYDRYLRIVSASSVIAERPDGQQVTFTSTNGAWTTDTDVDYKLTNSGSTWTLTDAHDSVETYSAPPARSKACCKRIRARNGYTQTLQYDSSNQLDDRHRFVQPATELHLQRRPLADGHHSRRPHPHLRLHRQLSSPPSATPPLPPTSQTYLYENTALPSALTGIIDENGNRYVTWTYDSKGRALSSQHRRRRRSHHDRLQRHRRQPHRHQRARRPGRSTSSPRCRGVPKVTEIDRPASADSARGDHASSPTIRNGYIASRTDWNGNVTNYVNDVHGQPTSITEAAGTPQARTTTITYHRNFHLPSKIVTPGLTTSFTYDTNGELLTRTSPTPPRPPCPIRPPARRGPGPTPGRISCSPRSRLREPMSPRVTKFTYDSSGALTAITNALGQTTQITQHLPGGLPQTIVDPNGVTTQPHLRRAAAFAVQHDQDRSRPAHDQLHLRRGRAICSASRCPTARRSPIPTTPRTG